ncbi:MAG: rhodanese-like domain-containing protein [Dehalococcoidales bacterium]|nr:rhodanese-like domain-containing protein [Dehalococcoidales bacterium]
MKRWLFLIGLAALLVSACGQSTPAVTTPAPATEREVPVDGESYHVINVTQLKAMLDSKDFLFVNVHIPYEGEIEGTDLFIPYNEIEKNLDKLPADTNARIIIYCRSGSMSSIAAKTLTRLGYTNITDVEGGMFAWEMQDYPLVQTPQ